MSSSLFLKISTGNKQVDETVLRLGIKDWEEWYTVDKTRLKSVLAPYNNSLCSFLLQSYPQYKWQLWRFSRENVPNGFWESREHQRNFLDWLAPQLNYNRWQDWYKV